MRILVTGAAGFIGSEVALALTARGRNSGRRRQSKHILFARIKTCSPGPSRRHTELPFCQSDIADHDTLSAALTETDFSSIIHLAAQAGVRYSISNPFDYGQSNLAGCLSMLELARQREVAHLVYASSSSVYGANEKTPFSEDDRTDAPVSLYGATKKANEAMCASYARLYNLPTTGLRFFTVYGPGADRTWHTGYSPTKFSRANLLRYSIMGRWGAISPLSMISWGRSCRP